MIRFQSPWQHIGTYRIVNKRIDDLQANPNIQNHECSWSISPLAGLAWARSTLLCVRGVWMQ
jgi:hypothetical protein